MHILTETLDATPVSTILAKMPMISATSAGVVTLQPSEQVMLFFKFSDTINAFSDVIRVCNQQKGKKHTKLHLEDPI